MRPLSRAGRSPRHPATIVRRWWPVPTIVLATVTAQCVLLTSRYDVGGHAAEHLAGATAPFMAIAVIVLLFWATPPARRQLELLATSALWFTATLLVMTGNLRVVDDLGAAGYSHTPTDAVPDVADHSLANSSVWYAELAALLVVVAWRRRGHIGNRSTIGAIVVTLIIPPWIIPGAGPILVLLVRLANRARTRRPAVEPNWVTIKGDRPV